LGHLLEARIDAAEPTCFLFANQADDLLLKFLLLAAPRWAIGKQVEVMVLGERFKDGDQGRSVPAQLFKGLRDIFIELFEVSLADYNLCVVRR
jgi:hypothetical protein